MTNRLRCHRTRSSRRSPPCGRSGAREIPTDAPGARHQRACVGTFAGWSAAAAALLLQAGREKRADLFTSTALLAELTDILGRRKFDRKIAASLLTIDQLVDRYAALAALVRPTPVPRIAPDPDDDVVIGTALAARADLLVTGDRALLSMTHYQGIGIVGVSDAVQAIATRGVGARDAGRSSCGGDTVEILRVCPTSRHLPERW